MSPLAKMQRTSSGVLLTTSAVQPAAICCSDGILNCHFTPFGFQSVELG